MQVGWNMTSTVGRNAWFFSAIAGLFVEKKMRGNIHKTFGELIG